MRLLQWRPRFEAEIEDTRLPEAKWVVFLIDVVLFCQLASWHRLTRRMRSHGQHLRIWMLVVWFTAALQPAAGLSSKVDGWQRVGAQFERDRPFAESSARANGTSTGDGAAKTATSVDQMQQENVSLARNASAGFANASIGSSLRAMATPNDLPLVHHPTRSLAVITVQPGSGTLQAAVDAASDGDELILEDGTYTGSGSNVLDIGKSITIRAQNPGQAILDGEEAQGVVSITSGSVELTGLNITKGYVCACFLNHGPRPRFAVLHVRAVCGMHRLILLTSTGGKCLLSDLSLNFPPLPRRGKLPRTFPMLYSDLYVWVLYDIFVQFAIVIFIRLLFI